MSAYLPITPFDEFADLEHYWKMDEATGVTRADSVASNDFIVSLGATQVAGHLGNATDTAELDASSFTAGAPGYTVGWWEEAVSAGAPTARGQLLLGTPLQCVTTISADVGVTTLQTILFGRPSAGSNTVLQSLPTAGRTWHFHVVVVDEIGLTTYGGDDLGTTLVVLADAFAGGDSFIAPDDATFDFSLIVDDMFQYSIPLDLAGVTALYNGGAGVPIF